MRYVVREHPIPRQGETGMAYVRRLEDWLNKDRTPLELVTITSHRLCVFVDRCHDRPATPPGRSLISIMETAGIDISDWEAVRRFATEKAHDAL